jgi:hypothetical protein
MLKKETLLRVRRSSISSPHCVVTYLIILLLTPRTCRCHFAFHSTVLAR